MRFFFLVFICFYSISSRAVEYSYLNLNKSYNSLGQVGLIQTPSAESMDEGSVALTLNKNNIWKIGTLTVTPFDWLEASYFYYRPSDLQWGGVRGLYLDKGFNVKFVYESDSADIPSLAIGLDDFAGTGYFTKEYIVATSQSTNFKTSIGLGWGKFAGINNFENPLNFISDGFKTRPIISDNYGVGGTPSFDKWFRGKASLFGGIEYFPRKLKGSSFKLEYDPYDYMDFSAGGLRDDASYILRKKDSNINLGINIPINNFISINASYIKGNTFNFSFNINTTFNEKLRSKPKFKPIIKIRKNEKNIEASFYEDLLLNLNSNNLFLQTASLEKEKLNVSISTSQYRNAIRSSSYAAFVANKISNEYDINLSRINISHINAGVELNNITFFAKHFDEEKAVPVEIIERYTVLDSGNKNSYKNHKFKPGVVFPAFFNTTSPVLVSYLGSPERFFYGGIELTNISEVQFRRNILLSSQVNYSLANDFDEANYAPDSVLEHVRTDKLLYLRGSDLYIKRLQLDYIWSPKKNIYAKLSSGIFEDMYGGFGGQILFKPFDSNLNLSIEGFYVRQRGYDQGLKFKKYKTTTAHLNISYLFPFGIESNLSYGRYLAQDIGYTLDLSRRTKSGFKAGVYFTRTNISAQMFGEGSFDKGFYIQVPMDLFSKNYSGSYSNFKLSPLTRDGGAKLEFDKDLKGLMFNTSLYDLKNGW
jgi:hypothetical protein